MTRKLVRICVISKHGSPANHSHSRAIYLAICQVHTRKYPLNNFLIDPPTANGLFSDDYFEMAEFLALPLPYFCGDIEPIYSKNNSISKYYTINN